MAGSSRVRGRVFPDGSDEKSLRCLLSRDYHEGSSSQRLGNAPIQLERATIMALTITCPGCKAARRVRKEYAGKQIKCPRCSEAVLVPLQATAPQAGEQIRPVARTAPPPMSVHVKPPPSVARRIHDEAGEE